MHRLTKVEHVQEELLRILMQPTALMVAKDASTADKLMEMHKAAPHTSAVEKFGSRTGGFSSKPKKGKKNKGKK